MVPSKGGRGQGGDTVNTDGGAGKPGAQAAAALKAGLREVGTGEGLPTTAMTVLNEDAPV